MHPKSAKNTKRDKFRRLRQKQCVKNNRMKKYIKKFRTLQTRRRSVVLPEKMDPFEIAEVPTKTKQKQERENQNITQLKNELELMDKIHACQTKTIREMDGTIRTLNEVITAFQSRSFSFFSTDIKDFRNCLTPTDEDTC